MKQTAIAMLLVLCLGLGLLAGCSTGGEKETAASAAPATTEAQPAATEAPATEAPAGTEPTAPVTEPEPLPEPEPCSLVVRPVTGMREDFILGMDASQVPALEASGVTYTDFDGVQRDVFRILARYGVNYIRVRVWNDPFDAQGHGYGGGNCTIDTALEIGRRATVNGMKLLVDFHYSDFWADPGKQMAPKAWKDLDLAAKTEALGAYTRESLQKLKDAGVDVGMVQVGNETNGAMCGETEWSNVIQLMAAGSAAVREVYPEALVAVHFANPESGAYSTYATNLKIYGLDYDVFGSSYYPYWHGSLENLTNVLAQVRRNYGKQVMVLETSYAWTTEDSDFSGNTISAESTGAKPYPYSLQGQVNNLRNVAQAVADADGMGVCYWEGTWISVGGGSKQENQKLWEEFGSGWASSYAAEYDPDDAGKWYGGCAVDNQAFFDADGHALESLKAFGLLRTGNDVPVEIESLDEIELRLTVGEPVVLPETVEAVMTDGTREALPVSWETDGEALQTRLNTEGPGTYVIHGVAGEAEATLRLIVEDVNLLANPSFEDGVDAPWIAENLGGCRELQIEEKTGDSRTGDWHYHFWSPDAGKAEFTLEQTPEDLEPGAYNYTIYIMGGDCGEAEVYAYVKLDGEIAATAPMEITAWNEWHRGSIDGIVCQPGQTLTVGIYVRAPQGGAWGKIDDASLNRVP